MPEGNARAALAVHAISMPKLWSDSRHAAPATWPSAHVLPSSHLCRICRPALLPASRSIRTIARRAACSSGPTRALSPASGREVYDFLSRLRAVARARETRRHASTATLGASSGDGRHAAAPRSWRADSARFLRSCAPAERALRTHLAGACIYVGPRPLWPSCRVARCRSPDAYLSYRASCVPQGGREARNRSQQS